MLGLNAQFLVELEICVLGFNLLRFRGFLILRLLRWDNLILFKLDLSHVFFGLVNLQNVLVILLQDGAILIGRVEAIFKIPDDEAFTDFYGSLPKLLDQ